MKIIKKIFKIISVLIVIVIVGIGCYIGFLRLSKIERNIRLDKERKNSKTLMEYVANHDDIHVHSFENAMFFVTKDFICEDLKNKDILYLSDDTMITSDYTIYDILTNDSSSTFSNNQHCKKVENDLGIKGILKSNYNRFYLVAKDNKHYIYKTNDNAETKKHFIPVEKELNNPLYENSLDFNIISKYFFLSTDYDYKTGIRTYLVIKDGNIVEMTYDNLNNFISEEVIYSKEDYGYIKLAKYDYELNFGSYIKEIQPQITLILSDKGLYTLKEIETDECKKYQDINCELKLVESEIYKKYNSDIKYIGSEYTMLNDFSIIKTYLFSYELDKEVK